MLLQMFPCWTFVSGLFCGLRVPIHLIRGIYRAVSRAHYGSSSALSHTHTKREREGEREHMSLISQCRATVEPCDILLQPLLADSDGTVEEREGSYSSPRLAECICSAASVWVLSTLSCLNYVTEQSSVNNRIFIIVLDDVASTRMCRRQ